MGRFFLGCAFLGGLGYVATMWAPAVKAAPEMVRETEQKAGAVAADLSAKATAIAQNPAEATPNDWGLLQHENNELERISEELGQNVGACRDFQTELTKKAKENMKLMADKNGDPILREEVRRQWNTANDALTRQIEVADQVLLMIDEARESAAILQLAGQVVLAAQAANRSVADLAQQSERAKLAASRFAAVTATLAQKIAVEREGETAGS